MARHRLDRFEGFLAAFENVDGGMLVDALLRLLREGPSVGLRVITTPGRRGLSGPAPAASSAGSMTALVGVGGDELAAVEVDLATDGPGFVIAGPPRSGRSSALLTMATTLLDNGARVALVLPRRSPLAALASAPGVAAVLDASARSDVIDPLLAGIAEHGPLAIIMDDAELLNDAPIAAKMVEFLRSARDTGSCLVAAATTEDLAGQFRGFLVDARRSRCGLVLAPSAPAEGELFGVRLSRAVGATVPPGRGLFFQRGKTTPVQVADPGPPRGGS